MAVRVLMRALALALFTCANVNLANADANSNGHGRAELDVIEYSPHQDDLSPHIRFRRYIAPEPLPTTNTTVNMILAPTVFINHTGPDNKTIIVPKNTTLVTTVTPDAAKNVTTTTQKPELINTRPNLGEDDVDMRRYNECERDPKADSTSICVSEPIVPDEGNSTNVTDDLNLDEFTEPQETLLADHNITQIKNDTHEYYNSSFVLNKDHFDEYWKMIMSSGAVIVTPVLSQSHKRAVIVNLSFAFPFYGHYVKNITIATGGFLYIGDYVHKWIAATQFIAPLMANFDAGLHNDSFVKYIDNGTSFTVLWENITLQDKNQNEKFTFAAHLKESGDITFAYKSVPIPIDSIKNDSHPVKVGLSDAFIIDKVFFLSRRKSIYEYHLVDFRSQPITNNTLIYLIALPTCQQYNTCSSCIQHETTFNCTWCPNIDRCSHGKDRNRQDWIIKNCEETKVTTLLQCQSVVTTAPNANPKNPESATVSSKNTSQNAVHPNDEVNYHKPSHSSSEGGPTAVTIGLTAFITAVGLAAWFLYAYRNPHTYSGQLLIKYRPSQWSWRRGEARYTAATIHM